MNTKTTPDKYGVSTTTMELRPQKQPESKINQLNIVFKNGIELSVEAVNFTSFKLEDKVMMGFEFILIELVADGFVLFPKSEILYIGEGVAKCHNQ